MSIRDELIEIVQPWVTSVASDGYLKSTTKEPESIADAILERFPWITEEHEVEWRDVWNEGDFDEESRYVTPWKATS